MNPIQIHKSFSMRVGFLIVLSYLTGCVGINEYRTTGTFIEDFSIERKVANFLKKDSELKDKTNVKMKWIKYLKD